MSQQDQLYYVSHSQGTVMGFAGFTTNETLASKVKKFFALAPVEISFPDCNLPPKSFARTEVGSVLGV